MRRMPSPDVTANRRDANSPRIKHDRKVARTVMDQLIRLSGDSSWARCSCLTCSLAVKLSGRTPHRMTYLRLLAPRAPSFLDRGDATECHDHSKVRKRPTRRNCYRQFRVTTSAISTAKNANRNETRRDGSLTGSSTTAPRSRRSSFARR